MLLLFQKKEEWRTKLFGQIVDRGTIHRGLSAATVSAEKDAGFFVGLEKLLYTDLKDMTF